MTEKKIIWLLIPKVWSYGSHSRSQTLPKSPRFTGAKGMSVGGFTQINLAWCVGDKRGHCHLFPKIQGDLGSGYRANEFYGFTRSLFALACLCICFYFIFSVHSGELHRNASSVLEFRTLHGWVFIFPSRLFIREIL